MQRAMNFRSHLWYLYRDNTFEFRMFEGSHVPELFFFSPVFIDAIDVNYDGNFYFCLWDSFSCFSWLVKLLLGISLGVCFLLAAVVGGCCWRRSRKRSRPESLLAPGIEVAPSYRQTEPSPQDQAEHAD